MSPTCPCRPARRALLLLAVAAGSRVRLLAETVADLDRDAPSVAAGPTVKVELAPGTALSAGALLGLTRAAEPVVALFQLSRAL